MRRRGFGEKVVGSVKETEDAIVGVVAYGDEDSGHTRGDTDRVLDVEVLKSAVIF